MNGENRAYQSRSNIRMKSMNRTGGRLFLALFALRILCMLRQGTPPTGLIVLLGFGVAELLFGGFLLKGKLTRELIYPAALYVLTDALNIIYNLHKLNEYIWVDNNVSAVTAVVNAAAGFAASVLLVLIISGSLKPRPESGEILRAWKLPGIIRGGAGIISAAVICLMDISFFWGHIERIWRLARFAETFAIPVLISLLSLFALRFLCQALVSGCTEGSGDDRLYFGQNSMAGRKTDAAQNSMAHPAAPADIPSEIRRWKKLQEDGIITAEEFEEKKKELLK